MMHAVSNVFRHARKENEILLSMLLVIDECYLRVELA